METRTAPAQSEVLSRAVLNGLLPPADTWPQARRHGTGAGGLTAAAEAAFRPSLSARLGEGRFWDSTALRADARTPLGEWTAHVEELGRWGVSLHADFQDQDPRWKGTNLVFPREGNLFPLESHFLTRGWLWYDFQPLQLEIGRDQIHWGPLDHSLLVSEEIPFLDLIRGSLHAGPWGLDWVLATPETRTGGGNSAVTKTSLMNLHRLEYKTDTWRLAVSELYLVARGPNGPFTLADVFPVMVQHQADMAPNNNSLVLDGEWVPVPGIRLMGQYGLDEVDAKTFGIPDDPIPTIWAFQLGAEWQAAWARTHLTLHGEFGYTHYLWGNFDIPEAKAQYLQVLFERTERRPLSSPYGPGTAWANFRAEWSRWPLTLEANAEIFTTKTGVSLDLPYSTNPAYEGLGSALSDRISLKASLALGADWSLSVSPVRMFHAGMTSFEGRICLEKRWSTQDPPTIRVPFYQTATP